MAAPSTFKKQRMAPPDAAFFLSVGQTLCNRNIKQGAAIMPQVRKFRSKFGTGPEVCAALWLLLFPDLIADEKACAHILWALMWLKTYAKEEPLTLLGGGVDAKTYRKWAWFYINAIADLEPDVVSNYAKWELVLHRMTAA
jgi:hypothetical protein